MIINIFTSNKERYELLGNYIKTEDNINYIKSINEITQGVILIDDDYQDAYQLCEVITKKVDFPIVMIAYNDSIVKESSALELGCFDYIKAPFSLEVLTLRLNKATNNSYHTTVQLAKNIFINMHSRQVINNDQEVVLTAKQFDIINYLVNNTNKTVSRHELIEKVWFNKANTNTRSIDTHIKNIRNLLPSMKIDTVSGVGYRLNAYSENSYLK